MDFPIWIIFLVFMIARAFMGNQNNRKAPVPRPGSDRQSTLEPRAEEERMPVNRPRTLRDELGDIFKEIEETLEDKPKGGAIREEKVVSDPPKDLEFTPRVMTESKPKPRSKAKPRYDSTTVEVERVQNKDMQLSFDSNSVLNGIIMSEVLGPPKARRINGRFQR